MTTRPAPFDWMAEDDDDLHDDLHDDPPVGLVSRRRLARLDNGTRPLLVHAHERCLN